MRCIFFPQSVNIPKNNRFPVRIYNKSFGKQLMSFGSHNPLPYLLFFVKGKHLIYSILKEWHVERIYPKKLDSLRK